MIHECIARADGSFVCRICNHDGDLEWAIRHIVKWQQPMPDHQGKMPTPR